MSFGGAWGFVQARAANAIAWRPAPCIPPGSAHGLDNVVEELIKFGFVRIHRSYVVNVARICEVEHHGKGVLTVSTDPWKQEAIPVSRRYTVKLRSLLGL